MPTFDTKLNHRLADYDGVIPTSDIRRYFERLITETTKLSGDVCLETMEINGQEQYVDKKTDALYLGFGMGMRCAERIAKTFEVHVASGQATSKCKCESCGKQAEPLDLDEVGFCNHCTINADHK